MAEILLLKYRIYAICDKPACLNHTHLLEDSGPANADPKWCRGVIICPQYNHMLIDLCGHEPKCIKDPFPLDQFDCCLPEEGASVSQAEAFSQQAQRVIEEIRSEPLEPDVFPS